MESRQAALLARLLWFTDLRWIVGPGAIGLALFGTYVLQLSLNLSGLAFLACAIVVYNLAFRRWLARIGRDAAPRQSRAVRRCANAQISFDLVAIALAVHFTGGVESPVALLFFLHMIIAAMIMPLPAAYGQATLVLVLYGVIVLLEAQGIIPHYRLSPAIEASFHRSPEAWSLVGGVVGVLYMAVYLTGSISRELRRREEQLEHLADELAQQAGQCRIAYRGLQNTQRRQLEYMQRVAHELKSPLSAISMMLGTILDSFPDTVPDKQREIMTRACVRAEAALTLTEDLLTLSQLKEGLPLEPAREVSVAHLIETVVSEAQAELETEDREVEFRLEIETGMPLIHAYEPELIRMLQNLLSNAIKYSTDGAVITIRAWTVDDSVGLSVADQGLGISEEDLPRIFDDFYRTQAGRQAGIQGTGLGLPIVKSVVDHHKGTLDVESALGEGTTFTITLPVQLATTT